MTAQSNNGVWGHSSTQGGDEFFIFSVDTLATLPLFEVMAKRHAAIVWLHQHDIPFKGVLGCYQGVAEFSFVVDWKYVGDIIASGLIKDQESILHVGKADRGSSVLHLGPCDARDRRPATLHGVSSTWSQYLGLFQSVSADEAKALDGFTYDPTQGQFFACLDKPRTTVSPEYTAIDAHSYIHLH